MALARNLSGLLFDPAAGTLWSVRPQAYSRFGLLDVTVSDLTGQHVNVLSLAKTRDQLESSAWP